MGLLLHLHEETRYVQTEKEKELFSVVFACEKFYQYIYGHICVVQALGIHLSKINQCNNSEAPAHVAETFEVST